MINEIIPVNTSEQYDIEAASCKDIFIKKMSDYGNAWRVLRVSSITDQVFIKAQRIRTIEETGEQLVEDGITSEFMGIVNYAVIALIQLELGSQVGQNIPAMNPDVRLDVSTDYMHIIPLGIKDEGPDRIMATTGVKQEPL